MTHNSARQMGLDRLDTRVIECRGPFCYSVSLKNADSSGSIHELCLNDIGSFELCDYYGFEF